MIGGCLFEKIYMDIVIIQNVILGALLLASIVTIFLQWRLHRAATKSKFADEQNAFKERVFEILLQNQQSSNNTLQQFSQQNNETQQQQLLRLQGTLREHFEGLEKQLYAQIDRSHLQQREQFDKLIQTTQQQLTQISETVEQRLSKGFEKTNETFTNIIQRLAIIDDAQKKIADLSKNVISLQDVLNDKRSRGAFGEIQLMTLINNVLPSNSYEAQSTLSNGNRVDCLLLLPEPTGKVAVDAKFPLENYKKYLDAENSETQRQSSRSQFKQDLKKHITDISQKYIIPGETSDGAVMFIPAEAIFAEIHAHHPDIVEFSHKNRVFMASPSTMMAILTTAAAVLKDSSTRQQIHVIQEHLRLLANDFSRFETRMEKLSKHIQQAHSDAEQVQISAHKITKRFFQIEQAEVSALASNPETATSVSLT